jgi:transcriptional regulator with XRE-family HTH domain
MTEDQATFGKRVAAVRKGRTDKMTQAQLGAHERVQRTAGWVSQVERGILPVDRVSVREGLAAALGVSLDVLEGELLPPPPAVGTAPPDHTIDELRLAVCGHPDLGDLTVPPEVTPANLEDLQSRVDEVWESEHATDYPEVTSLLPPLINDLERALRRAPAEQVPVINGLLCRAYQAASATFARRDEREDAEKAADRSLFAGERSTEPLQAVAGHFRLAHSYMGVGRLAEAEHVTTAALNALAMPASRDNAQPEVLSLLGAMHLVLANIRARESDAAGAWEHIDQARAVADRIGDDRNDFNTEFGPANVGIEAAGVAIVLGDSGRALQIVSEVDASGLSNERQARLLMYRALAHAGFPLDGVGNHLQDSIAAILRAEAIAPEFIRTHRHARGLVARLVRLSGRHVPKDLQGLAERADVDLEL